MPDQHTPQRGDTLPAVPGRPHTDDRTADQWPTHRAKARRRERARTYRRNLSEVRR